MILAIVDFHVLASDRAAAFDILTQDAGTARGLPGNAGFRVFADAGSETHVGLMSEWQDSAAFDAYLASPGFAAAGAALRPLMTAPPTSRRFDARLYETVR